MSNDELKLLKELNQKVSLLIQRIDQLTSPGKLRSKFWTAEQTMEFLSMSRNTLYKYASQLGGHKVGRRWLFKPDLVANFYLKGE
jgi:hypothetical protein